LAAASCPVDGAATSKVFAMSCCSATLAWKQETVAPASNAASRPTIPVYACRAINCRAVQAPTSLVSESEYSNSDLEALDELVTVDVKLSQWSAKLKAGTLASVPETPFRTPAAVRPLHAPGASPSSPLGVRVTDAPAFPGLMCGQDIFMAVPTLPGCGTVTPAFPGCGTVSHSHSISQGLRRSSKAWPAWPSQTPSPC